MSAAVVVSATVRNDIADYLQALLTVYLILIFAYIVINIVFAVGIRPPFSRWSGAVLSFLREVVEPYLRIFRRVLPPFGPLDLSPMIATFALIIVGGIVVELVRG